MLLFARFGNSLPTNFPSDAQLRSRLFVLQLAATHITPARANPLLGKARRAHNILRTQTRLALRIRRQGAEKSILILLKSPQNEAGCSQQEITSHVSLWNLEARRDCVRGFALFAEGFLPCEPADVTKLFTRLRLSDVEWRRPAFFL